jgi:ubiquinone/menaquinone biosynthesis C-methylase UbiE
VGMSMTKTEANAQKWELGCQADIIRNSFLVPNLIRILDSNRPESIVDVGTGTGFIPRALDASLSYRPLWTLIDIDEARLRIADKLRHPSMRATILKSDIMSHSFEGAFEAALLTFTLLEIEDFRGLIDRLTQVVALGGLLVVSLPDTWSDVIDCGLANPEKLSEFLKGQTSIPKIDKFTGSEYPFRAVRIEHLISSILSSGFELVELTERQQAENQVYLLVFRRTGVKK